MERVCGHNFRNFHIYFFMFQIMNMILSKETVQQEISLDGQGTPSS